MALIVGARCTPPMRRPPTSGNNGLLRPLAVRGVLYPAGLCARSPDGALGETALHIAALFNSLEAAVALIEAAPDVINEPIVSDLYKGVTALHIAVINENMNLVQELIHRGAEVDTPRATGECFQKKTKNLGYFGEHILAFAACTGNKKIVQLLIENGADIRAQDKHGNTVLHVLVFQLNRISSCKIYDLIMACDLKENNRISLDLIRNSKGLTPFKLAAAEGNSVESYITYSDHLRLAGELISVIGAVVILLLEIMFSDMLRFIYLMTFTVIGFTAALWMAYMTQDPSADPQFGDFPTSFFVEFELSLGLLDIPLNYSVWTPNIVKVLHAALTIFAFLLIMNLLIAMLGDTQTRVAQERDEIWRAQVVATIIMLERRLPRWMWTRFGICGKQYGLENKWYLRVESPKTFSTKKLYHNIQKCNDEMNKSDSDESYMEEMNISMSKVNLSTFNEESMDQSQKSLESLDIIFNSPVHSLYLENDGLGDVYDV
ncbi:TRPV6 protein, partial [Polypterus senegalus]